MFKSKYFKEWKVILLLIFVLILSMGTISATDNNIANETDVITSVNVDTIVSDDSNDDLMSSAEDNSVLDSSDVDDTLKSENNDNILKEGEYKDLSDWQL